MNLLAKTSLGALLLLSPLVRAEYIRTEGSWQIKPGTQSDVTPAERVSHILLVMDRASREAEAGDSAAALKVWAIIAEAERGTEAEAVSLVQQARLFTARGQFENASALINELHERQTNFSGFQQAVQLQFEIGNHYAAGDRRYLGGWFPWFRDPVAAIGAWEVAVKLAPHGPLADECLIRAARLALGKDITAKADEILERLVSDYASSKHAPEALEMLATLRSNESMGPDWDQSTTNAATDHWRTLAEQFPNHPRAKNAAEQIALLRDRAARARLNLAKFYWLNRNNPEAAKLMANSCRTLSPDSAAAKEAQALLDTIQKDPTPPKSLADKLLGVYPRPKMSFDVKPTVVGEDLDSLGFKKEAPKSATDTERR